MSITSHNTHVYEHQFRVLVEHNIDGIVIIQHDSVITFVNPAACELFQRTADELLGAPFGFPIIADQTTEIDLLGRNGSVIPVEMRMVTVEWEGKTSYLASLRDLTERRKSEEERKRFEAQLQYTQKLESLGVLAGGIAHDFNNLLMAIVARAGLALRTINESSPAYPHLKHVEKSGLRGGELANQMLTYAGKGKLVIKSIDGSQLIKEMAHLLRISISKRAELKYNLAPNLPHIEADPSQFRQLILSVLTNASEAIGDNNGVITISTDSLSLTSDLFKDWYVAGDLPSSHCVFIDVCDTGSGMDPTTIPKIFDPFFTTKFTGRGLGLAALLGIVRAHNGAVAVISRPGEGTHFRLLFPTQATQQNSTLPPPDPSLYWKGSGTALVVDDEEDVRVASQLILEEVGFTVLTAHDGHAGL
ncbi:MAG: ATP-binding protein, partial [Nitrospirales bacterium]